MTTNTDGAFGLLVRFTVKPGGERDFDELTAATVAEVQQREPDTLLYLCHKVEGAPNQRIFYELYRDRSAFDAHEAQPHVRRFLLEREALLDRMDVDVLALTVHAATVADRG
jgi:quinol monooxygenase YgiN